MWHNLDQQSSPVKSWRNIAKTRAAFGELLKGGTPKWVSHPKDYKNFAIEDYLQWKERSDKMAAQFRWEDQDLYTDVESRLIRPMWTRVFIDKLRTNGVKCHTRQANWNEKAPPPWWLANTTGLYAEVPSQRELGFQKICNLFIPRMFEWSILLTDEHNLPCGQVIGWRTAVSELIIKKVLTETKAHEIFGEPSGAQSVPYRRKLFKFRNGVIKDNDGPIEAPVKP